MLATEMLNDTALWYSHYIISVSDDKYVLDDKYKHFKDNTKVVAVFNSKHDGPIYLMHCESDRLDPFYVSYGYFMYNEQVTSWVLGIMNWSIPLTECGIKNAVVYDKKRFNKFVMVAAAEAL